MGSLLRVLWAYFSLYINDGHLFEHSLWVLLLLLYGNTILYLIDFYGLIKQRSGRETVATMLMPGTIALMGSALVAIFLYVPSPGEPELEAFLIAMSNSFLHMGFLFMVGVWLLLWGIFLRLQKERSRSEFIYWLISCAPDFAYVLVITVFSAWSLAGDKNPFTEISPWFLWVFINAVLLLGCKIIFLTVGLIARIYSLRIRIMGFLYFAGVFVILVSIAPIIATLGRFRTWERHGRASELFCREYFTEEPIFKDSNYTVTRHFLVDEHQPAAVYYLPAVANIGGWHVDKKGKSKTITFLDGTSCVIPQESEASDGPVSGYAREWRMMDTNDYRERWKKQDPMAQRYQKIIWLMAMVIIAFMMAVTSGNQRY